MTEGPVPHCATVEQKLSPLPCFYDGVPLQQHWLSPTLGDLERWVDTGGETVARLEGLAGWGKTSVIQTLANRKGVLYFRLPGKDNCFLDEMIYQTVEEVNLLLTGRENVTVGEVLEMLQPIVDKYFFGLLAEVAKIIEKKVPASELEVSLVYSDLLSGVAIPAPEELPRLILFFDNMECLQTKQQSIEVVSNETAVVQDSCIYIWFALCDVVARACERYPELRIVFALDKNDIAHHVPLSRPVKLAEITPLTLPSEDQIESLLHYYLDGGRADDYDLKWVARQLVGPPRIVQQFLSYVTPSAEKGRLREEEMDEAIARVRETHQWELVTTFNLHHERFRPMLKAVCEVWATVRKSLANIERAKLNRAMVTMSLKLPTDLPDSWHEVEGCGLMQSRPGAGGRVVDV